MRLTDRIVPLTACSLLLAITTSVGCESKSPAVAEAKATNPPPTLAKTVKPAPKVTSSAPQAPALSGSVEPVPAPSPPSAADPIAASKIVAIESPDDAALEAKPSAPRSTGSEQATDKPAEEAADAKQRDVKPAEEAAELTLMSPLQATSDSEPPTETPQLKDEAKSASGPSLLDQSPEFIDDGRVDAKPVAATMKTESVPAVISAPQVPESTQPPEQSETTKTGESAELIDAADVDDEANAKAAEPDAYDKWPEPSVALVFSGNQHGYIEPCGCTGLDRQKGGVARRFTFLEGLRSKGWNVVPMDAGNQVRRFGSQAEIKFHSTMTALKAMDYQSVGMGPDDIRLGVGELISEAVDDGAILASANVVLLDPDLMPAHRTIESGGMRIGVCSLLDPDALVAKLGDEIQVNPTKPAAEAVLAAMKSDKSTFNVLTFYGTEEAAEKLVAEVKGFDLLVVTGGYGEPTYQAEAIEGTTTKKIVTGNKGMYAGVVGLYPDAEFKYARVPLTHEFKDAPEMRQLMAAYQNQLKVLGLEGLGLRPVPHPSGKKFVGSKACAECHTNAWDIWESSGHAHATDSIVKPPKERGDIARHFDPECISCHVTGWNAQNYYPYESGYLSLEESAHLTGNGCENCHGPGAEHTAAEQKDSGVAKAQRDLLRKAMQLPLEKAREKCMECHDLDNSPDFHDKDAFEDIYWPEIEHYGVD